MLNQKEEDRISGARNKTKSKPNKSRNMKLLMKATVKNGPRNSTETRVKHLSTNPVIENAIVKHAKGFYLYVTLSKGRKGRIHISEISDKVANGQRPLTLFRHGQEITVKTFGLATIRSDGGYVVTRGHMKSTFVECSMRPSVLSGDVLNEQKYKVGDMVTSYVLSHDKDWVYLYIGRDVKARVSVLNLSTRVKDVKHYKKHFRIGHGFNFYVIRQRENFYELSAFPFKDLNDGSTVIGRILNSRRNTGLIVALPFRYKGHVHLTDMCDEYKHSAIYLNDLPNGKLVKCAVISVKRESKDAIISLRKSRTIVMKDVSLVVDKEYEWEDIKLHTELRGFVCGIAKTRLFVTVGRNMVTICPIRPGIPNHLKTVGAVVRIQITKREEVDEKRELSGVVLVTEEDIAMESVISIPEEPRTSSKKLKSIEEEARRVNETSASRDVSTDCVVSPKNLPHLEVSTGFVWDLSTITNDKAASDSSEDEEDDSAVTTKKKKHHKFSAEKLEEERLINTELMLMDSTRQPQSVDDFDRMVLGSPNSSIIWTNYIAFHLQSTEIEKARAVAERALKTISFREEQEKLNIWVVLLNLENLYGTQESMKNVLHRALQYNEPLKVYEHVVNIYRESKKYDLAEQTYGILLKKYSTNSKVWIDYGTFLMKSNQQVTARKLMDRSLNSLQKKDHFSLISKFAQLEFKYGDAERGNTMFESILANYPKRFDIWSIYVDVLTKVGSIEKAREIFKKATTVSAPMKKLKFLLHKFVDFERLHGDDDTLAYAKEMLSECDQTGETKFLTNDDDDDLY